MNSYVLIDTEKIRLHTLLIKITFIKKRKQIRFHVNYTTNKSPFHFPLISHLHYKTFTSKFEFNFIFQFKEIQKSNSRRTIQTQMLKKLQTKFSFSFIPDIQISKPAVRGDLKGYNYECPFGAVTS